MFTNLFMNYSSNVLFVYNIILITIDVDYVTRHFYYFNDEKIKTLIFKLNISIWQKWQNRVLIWRLIPKIFSLKRKGLNMIEIWGRSRCIIGCRQFDERYLDTTPLYHSTMTIFCQYWSWTWGFSYCIVGCCYNWAFLSNVKWKSLW